SGGSASSVAANLVTCAISEEGAPSIRMPSRLNNGVGLSQSQGLVSRDGMIGGGGLNDPNGAACPTLQDVARGLDGIAGYDPEDDLTVYSLGRVPKRVMQAIPGRPASKGSGSASFGNIWTSACSRRRITRQSISSTEPLAISVSSAPQSLTRDPRVRCSKNALISTFRAT